MNAGCVAITISALAALSASAPIVLGDGNEQSSPGPANFERVYTDPPGDARIRRTDEYALYQPPILPGAGLPDLRQVRLIGWAPADPAIDPYTGVGVMGAHILRIDILFDGLVNPPGPLGIGGFPFEPYRFGPNPVFGFIEIDVDNDFDTGGEVWGEAVYRYLGNTGRFSAIPNDITRERVPLDVFQLADTNFFTPPFFERTGADFTLKLCGCFDVVHIASDIDAQDGDIAFTEGETMIVEGRFFQRASGYQGASAAFGGADFGLYDPIVQLRFEHTLDTNQTLVSLVFPLTPFGAAQLTGEPIEPIDLNVANHASMHEALDDIIVGAGGALAAETSILTSGWAGDDPTLFLDPASWRATAIIGTAYPESRSPSLYIYTDIGFNARNTDINGDGQINLADRELALFALNALDGGPQDLDLTINGSVELINFSLNFSPFDINYDGFIDNLDLDMLPQPITPGDLNADGVVDTADLGILLANFGALATPKDPNPADLNGDGVVDTADLGVLLANFGL